MIADNPAPQRRAPAFNRAALFTIGATVAVGYAAIAGVIIDNPGEVAPLEAARPALAIFLFAVTAVLALQAAGGFFRHVSTALPIIFFAVLKFSGFYGAGEYFRLSESGALAAAAIGLLLVSALSVHVASRRNAEALSGALFFFAAAICGGLSALALSSLSQGGGAADDAARSVIAAAPRPEIAPAGLPDIIYIVPDRYGATESFRREFGFDNSPFLKELESRGFYVARNARSNYAKTVVSLASSMNMSSLDAVAAAASKKSTNRAPLRRLIADNAVQDILRRAGYRYIHLGSWWQETRRSPHADADYYGVETLWASLSEFEHALLRTTPLAFAATYGGFVERNECERLKNQLDYLENIRRRGSAPLFVFAHLTLPHDPVTMDASGRCIKHVYYPGYGTPWSEYRAAYAGYVEFLNRRLLEIFDANAAARGGKDLIFVIQADEGPYPKRLHENLDMEMHAFSDDEIREKFGIINALHWDAEKYGPPILTRTPVNNWRIILSKISGDEIPLIAEERSMLMRSDEFVYDMKDVTDILDPAAD